VQLFFFDAAFAGAFAAVFAGTFAATLAGFAFKSFSAFPGANLPLVLAAILIALPV